MIARYQRPEMRDVWSLESRFNTLLDVEIAVALTQAELGIIPRTAARAIETKARVDVNRVEQIERVTKHDIIAFVSQIAESVGSEGRFIHFGLTSSDVLDTAMSLQCRKAYDVLVPGLRRLEKAFATLVKQHSSTLCAGRTHGMHAEPTTFGLKMASYLEEFIRHHERLDASIQHMQIVKLSGAVGTYSSLGSRLGPELEKRVGKRLGLVPEAIATQVIPRDRHAELLLAIALWASGVERVCIELRHLQRTELNEAEEGFTQGQKGSSAMPHKRNPISAENMTGLARLMRSYAIPALEDVALWHERDISHSSVERVVFPDAFILADYVAHRLSGLLENLVVKPDEMKKNMERSRGQMLSSQALLLLVEKGWTREDAYKKVQFLSHNLKEDETLRDALVTDRDVSLRVKEKEWDTLFSGEKQRRALKELSRNVLSRFAERTQMLKERDERRKGLSKHSSKRPSKNKSSGKKK